MMNPVLSKISKLLALSKDKHATEAEAALAAEHVQRLLQEHNLSLSEVEAAGGSSDAPDASREKVTLGSAVRPWQKTLMSTLAESNFCLHQILKSQKQGSPSKHFLIGRRINVEATGLTYNYLVEAMTRCMEDAGYVAIVDRVTSRGRKYSRDGQLFLEGAANKLALRLEERRRVREAEDAARKAQAQATGSTKNALVLSDVYGSEADLNNDVLNGFPPGTTAAKHREVVAREAARKIRQEELVAGGMEKTKAFYVSYGYSEEVAAEVATSINRRRRRGGRGYSQRWTSGNSREYAKVNSTAYRAGTVAGSSIGLEPQVGATVRKQLSAPKGGK